MKLGIRQSEVLAIVYAWGEAGGPKASAFTCLPNGTICAPYRNRSICYAEFETVGQRLINLGLVDEFTDWPINGRRFVKLSDLGKEIVKTIDREIIHSHIGLMKFTSNGPDHPGQPERPHHAAK